MKRLTENLKGLYLKIKKDNFKILFSKEKIQEKIKNFPTWMSDQIERDFRYFKDNDIDATIENFKRKNLLKSAQLVRIKIRNNKFEYQNFLPIKYHPRFIRLQNFFTKASEVIKFPDVDFLYSIHDCFENKEWLNCLKTPIFCISKLKGNQKVVLFPHVEWMQKNDLLLALIGKAALQFDWPKKINKAFWRGTITGHENLEKNERFKLVKFVFQYPEFFDVRLTDISLNEKNKKLLKKYYTNQNFHPSKQLRNKYLLAIDGNAFAGSFFWQLFSNSVILKNKSDYLEWYYTPLKNNEHYIEYSNEKELLQKVEFLKQNDDNAKKISKNASCFANENLSRENILIYIYKLLNTYSFSG